DDAWLLLAATLAPILAAVRVVVTGILSTLDQATTADVIDLGFGLLALGCLTAVVALLFTWPPRVATEAARARSAGTELFVRVLDVTLLVIFGVGLTGATVRAVGASWACRGMFPDCNAQGVLPFGRDPLADIQLYHRLLAYVALALVTW